MNPTRKSKPPRPVDLPRDRLTFSAWPPKVDGVGNGVRPAFIIALVVCGLLLANIVAGVFKPTTSPNLLSSAIGYFAPKGR